MVWLDHIVPATTMSLSQILPLLVTWPYHRSLMYFTVEPSEKLAEDLKKEPSELPRAINHWVMSKRQEYDFVCNASTLAAIADISVFSWTDIGETYWLATALFYFSLSLSLWAVITSAQQKSVSRTLAVFHDTPEEVQLKAQIILRYPPGLESHEDRRRTFAELNMLYVWQCPLMLMSYGWGTLLLGLSLHICSPLIDYTEPQKKKVAIFYIVTAVVLFFNFVWASAWSFWRPKMTKDEEKAFEHRNSIASVPPSPMPTRDSIAWSTTPFPGQDEPCSPKTCNSGFNYTTRSTTAATLVPPEPRLGVPVGMEEKEKRELFGHLSQ